MDYRLWTIPFGDDGVVRLPVGSVVVELAAHSPKGPGDIQYYGVVALVPVPARRTRDDEA